MRKQITLLLFMFIAFCVHAQTVNVKGVVTDATTGDPLPGVSVIVKGTVKGTQTDFDGMYNISNVTTGATLVFRYLGYKETEVLVKNATVNVSLEVEAQALDEIVVIGYGTQKRAEVTGAVSVVSNETIENLKPTRIEQALQGQVAGVNITSSSGAPGAGLNIRIRGVSTNGNNNPLILLDGNVIEDLSVVNPSDIESMNVLKDATAGIYGVRGANGVILITTKKGRKNTEFKYTFNSYVGFQQTTRKIPLLNATEYALLANEAFAANGEALPFSNILSLGQGTDWQNEVFKDAIISSADINITKGTEKSTFSFGASHLDQDGIVGGSKANFNRTTAKFGFSHDILKNLKFKSSSIYTNTNRKGLPENALGSVLFNALNMPANLTPRDANGDFTLAPNTGVGIEVINPLAQTQNSFNRTWVNKFAGSYGLNYSFLDGFSAESNIQFNYAKVNSKSYTPELFYGSGKVFNTVGAASDLNDGINNSSVFESQQTYKDYTFDAFIKYEKVFNDVHDVKILLGTSVFKSEGINDSNLLGFGANGNTLEDVSVAGADSSQDNLALSNQPRQFFDSRLLSYFTRLQYNYDGKYLFSAVVRRDGSSNFGPKNKFGIFPTASIGWVASKESFLEDSEAISFLKLRASYGVIGNDRIGSFGFVSTISGEGEYVFNNQINFGTAIGALSNPEIKWERQIPLDFGIDIELFDKINITADYFNKRTEDLLLNPQVSGILGVSAPGSAGPIVNAGTVENRGFEFAIGYKERISEDFKFSMNYNFTTIKNEVLFVGSESGVLFGGSFGVGQEPPSRMEAGLPIGYYYGFKTNGIFQNQAEVDAHATQTNANPGDLRFVDQLTVDTDNDGIADATDGIINNDDKTYIGDPIADVTMGFNFSFDYKNFDFNMYAFASIGNEIVRNYERNLPLTNRPTYYLDRWTGPGTSNTFPRVTTGATGNSLFSDFYVEDGSFLRLQNIQLGYSLKNNITEQVGLSKLRFYVTANNLFTLTKYRGFDPTTSNGAPIGGGIDQGFYPTPKTFLVGLNVNF
ncbi:TonB-dependent receptor [Polaribacter haliotis]|uniref:TonB-dependent receptor n=1 Tax=Polaribacter haliotis TaxID=1888915 RepID=A0A7L8AFU5_9FLAO|nr:TonB-dependent receptor [Polaribacter haliotis]QOD60881.1 TonB-dependent receptor [Polaribacter haliotis]